MKPKLFLLYLSIILLPLGLLMFVGFRVARFEQEEIKRQFEQLLLRELAEIEQKITAFLDQREQQIIQVSSDLDRSTDSMKMLGLKHAFISQVFYLAATGVIIYPSPTGDLTNLEWDFLNRTKDILINKKLIQLGESEQVSAQSPQQSIAPQKKSRQQFYRSSSDIQQEELNLEPQGPKTQGWFSWFWGQDLHLLYWQRESSGNVFGVEVDRIRFLADVIALLPSNDMSTAGQLFSSRISLSDPAGETLYQWGDYEQDKTDRPVVEKILEFPLKAWKLSYYVSPEQLTGFRGRKMYFSLLLGLIAIGLAVIGLAFYFYRENTREIRQASQRVTFVNQVSHELKTPLTNIRMYAELLENQLFTDDEKIGKYLSIIISESQRLSRLIGNILCFSRRERKKLSLRLSVRVVDEILQAVLDNFKASLEKQGITVTFKANAPASVQCDPDIIEQIVGNLINNVEKYASSGSILVVDSKHVQDTTVITVSDHGPGIASKDKERIFLPFTRLSSKLTDGVSGTGIGLAIARDLARLHGGDLKLLSSQVGATFQFHLKTPTPETGG